MGREAEDGILVCVGWQGGSDDRPGDRNEGIGVVAQRGKATHPSPHSWSG